MFGLKLGKVLVTKTFLVVDIDNEILLRADVLQKDAEGPVCWSHS